MFVFHFALRQYVWVLLQMGFAVPDFFFGFVFPADFAYSPNYTQRTKNSRPFPLGSNERWVRFRFGLRERIIWRKRKAIMEILSLRGHLVHLCCIFGSAIRLHRTSCVENFTIVLFRYLILAQKYRPIVVPNGERLSVLSSILIIILKNKNQ